VGEGNNLVDEEFGAVHATQPYKTPCWSSIGGGRVWKENNSNNININPRFKTHLIIR